MTLIWALPLLGSDLLPILEHYLLVVFPSARQRCLELFLAVCIFLDEANKPNNHTKLTYVSVCTLGIVSHTGLKRGRDCNSFARPRSMLQLHDRENGTLARLIPTTYTGTIASLCTEILRFAQCRSLLTCCINLPLLLSDSSSIPPGIPDCTESSDLS